MKTLNIYLGPSGSGKSRALFTGAVKNAAQDIRKNHLVIVPEQVSHVVTERILSLSESHGIMNIDVLSFNRLAHRIFDNAGGDNKEIIDDTGKNLILKTVISECEDELQALKKNVSKIGYINEIKSVISEFVQYEISPEDILKIPELKDRKYLSQKLRDIYVLYKAFRKKTEEKYVTREELLDRAAEAADRAGFLKGASLYLDDFTGFTPIQYRFLESVLKYADDVSIALDYDGYDGELFSLSVNTIAKLRQIAESESYKINTIHFYDEKEGRFKDNPELSRLEKRLFRTGNEKDKDDPYREKKPENIFITRALSPEREAEYVINRILYLVRQGYRFREIGIVMSDPKLYSRALSAEAERESVPLFIDSTAEILLNPYTEFIRSSIEAVIDNMSYESVFHFVRSGLSGIEDREADRLENYVRAMNIRGKKKYREPFRIHTKRLSEDEFSLINESRQKISDMLQPLMEAMSGGRNTAAFFTSALKIYLERTGVRERTALLCEKLKEDEDLERAESFSQVPDKVDELLSRIESLIPDEKMTLKEFREILDAGFEAIRIGVLPPGLDHVKAGDTERSRMDNIRVLFFMGMNDGLIPAGNTGKGLLSDLDREFLKERGMELSPTARERTGLNKLYFYMNVTKPSEKLVFSFSGADGDGKALNPSFFLNEVKSVFPGIETREYRGREEIFTEGDLFSLFAESLKDEEGLKKAREIYASISGDPGRKQVLDSVLDFCFRVHGKDRISEAVSRALYGDMKELSPSRLEQFAECAYRHFMLYGLRAMEREEFGFERRDLGSVLHNVLCLTSDMIALDHKSIKELKEEEMASYAGEALDRYLRENENLVLLSSERNRYFIKRISRILNATVSAVRSQSKKGSFDPVLFEKEFKKDGLRGRIDRIDTAEKENKLYVSVIDYKSGNKEFDLTKVYYGLDLQLVIYLNGAMEIERIDHPDKEVKPAGIFYFHIDDPVIKEEELNEGTEEERKDKRLSEMRLRGIVNSNPDVIRLFDGDAGKKSSVIPVSFKSDGSFSPYSSVADEEQFKVITEHVKRKALEIREEIKRGEIEPSPAVYSDLSPCSYCGFSDCCRFDGNIPGFEERRLKKDKDIINEFHG